MIKIYEDIESERDRIQACIDKYGWTSDHNLDWFAMSAIDDTGRPMFVEFNDGTGMLVHKYAKEWSLWSDPLSDKKAASDRIIEFASFALNGDHKEVWCVDIAENLRGEIIKKSSLKVNNIWYSLLWPVLDMCKYDPVLPGGSFKEIRNAKNKFYREHKVQVLDVEKLDKKDLNKIIDAWKGKVSLRQNVEDIYDLRYRRAVDNNFKGFKTARALIADGKPVGFNAGYEIPNHPDRFAGVVGIHDYSLNDLGVMLWLEDLEWIKNYGYKELDMQGSEDDGGLKLKLGFGAEIERKSDTFSIQVK